MKAEYLILHDCSEWQVVEQLNKLLPHVRVAVFPETLVVKAVNLGYLSAFVVASQDGQSGRVPYFQSNQQGHCLH